jgi:phosphatidylserine/phosphatidylglycerophosphate/cardiolipin synthase-like enzyme
MDEKRKSYNERFLQRLLRRRPQDRDYYLNLFSQNETGALEAVRGPDEADQGRAAVLETIVDSERPVMFVRAGEFDTTEVTTLGNEAVELVARIKQASTRLLPMLPLIGRIDVVNFPGSEFVGTGWFVDNDIVVTNRHVASLIARVDRNRFVFSRGIAGRSLECSLCNAHEFDDLAPDAGRIFKIKEVLYIEPDSGPNDIAFLKVERRTSGAAPGFIPVLSSNIDMDLPVCVIGYPARAPKRLIPDQALMEELFRGRFDVKRVAPGFSTGMERGSSTHDCTTLGGNSGSVVIDLQSGRAAGLHFAGVYKENNYAVPAAVLTDYIRRKRWNTPFNVESRPQTSKLPPAATAPLSPSAPATGVVSFTLPLTISVSVGSPLAPSSITATTAAPVLDAARVESVVVAFWDSRPDGVLAARVGYFDDGDRIGDRPCIAASVDADRLTTFESTGPKDFQGVPIRYLPANIEEQLQSHPVVESVDSISYDDDARTGQKFSFAEIEEQMDMILHVGPEYSWEVLKQFLGDAQISMVSAMYEFHAKHIKNAIEQRLKEGVSLKLVLDNATFTAVKDEDSEFDREPTFDRWADKFTFERITAPEGTGGLISDSYHIKVTVRDDDTFWLSSGNWKAGSSQPLITQAQRDNFASEDLPGNREWHVVIRNRTLSTRFQSHILQDFERSVELSGEAVAGGMDDILVDVPEEEFVLERKPPSALVEPRNINRKVKVKPLLTPDKEGAIYSKAVLRLIESARTSLLFQIPYISMPSNPRQDRGFIDELIRALTQKLKTLDDARVILRSGGSKFSSPAHAGWFFKSKGVDIDNRLRVIENHHTKGMIVDGRRVLLGSHNWSKPGVTLNRDASLLFDDTEVAEYYTTAFEIDWARANRVRPKKFIQEAVMLEAVGVEPPPGFKRVRLSELLSDD